MNIKVQISTCGMLSQECIQELRKLKQNDMWGQCNQWTVLDALKEEFNMTPLLERLNAIREELVKSLGFILPGINVKDNIYN